MPPGQGSARVQSGILYFSEMVELKTNEGGRRPSVRGMRVSFVPKGHRLHCPEKDITVKSQNSISCGSAFVGSSEFWLKINLLKHKDAKRLVIKPVYKS